MLELKKTIGKWALLLITLNAILGTGIFFLPAIGAKYAGPASILSWIIMSIVAIAISMYFAELISMFPKSGGVYEYIKKAYGEFYSFIFGWTAWIIANITIAMLIVGSLFYLFPGQPLFFNLGFSIAAILFFNYVSYRGTDISKKMLVFFGVMTLIALFALIIPGIPSVNMNNFDPFFVMPIPLVFLAIYFVSETFFGWETATYLSEEVKNARKVMPKMLIWTTIIIAAISLLLVFVSIGTVGHETFGQQDTPLVFLSNVFFGSEFSKIFAIIVFIPLIGTAASWIVSSPRLLYAMSRDKVLIRSFQKIHKKYRTPHNAIIFQTVVTCFVTIVGFASYMDLLSLLIPLVLILYSVVLLSFVKLRRTMPNAKRNFKAPFGKTGPVIIILFNIALLLVWMSQVSDAILLFSLGIIFMLLGIPLYIIIKLQTDEKFVEKFYDRLSGFFDKLFPIWYGKEERRKVIERLKLKNRNNVLDFGCGSGITTYEIAKRIPDGKIIAVDLSEKQILRAEKKISRMDLPNVVFVKENKIKFGKPCFDAITAVGVLELLEKPEATIRKLMKSLKKGGRFSFLSFGKSLGTPAPYFLRDEKKLKKMFSDVELHIKKEKEKATEYYYIWGKKK
jgi:APA family basic amino acid/polyamine antiporter/amino acid efflux transporter